VDFWCFAPQFPVVVDHSAIPGELRQLYPQQEASHPWCMAGPLLSMRQGLLRHGINTFLGSEGSPILDLGGQLLGMHVLTTTSLPAQGIGIELSHILEAIAGADMESN
jgi:hypothetical protein